MYRIASPNILEKEGMLCQEINLLELKGSKLRTFHQWLVNFFKDKDLQDIFGLKRVVYSKESMNLYNCVMSILMKDVKKEH